MSLDMPNTQKVIALIGVDYLGSRVVRSFQEYPSRAINRLIDLYLAGRWREHESKGSNICKSIDCLDGIHTAYVISALGTSKESAERHRETIQRLESFGAAIHPIEVGFSSYAQIHHACSLAKRIGAILEETSS